MRTISIALASGLLLVLLGCAQMQTVARHNPCAVENSYECQVDRSARVP